MIVLPFFLALAEELIKGVVACVLSSEATMNEPMIFSFFGSAYRSLKSPRYLSSRRWARTVVAGICANTTHGISNPPWLKVNVENDCYLIASTLLLHDQEGTLLFLKLQLVGAHGESSCYSASFDGKHIEHIPFFMLTVKGEQHKIKIIS